MLILHKKQSPDGRSVTAAGISPSVAPGLKKQSSKDKRRKKHEITAQRIRVGDDEIGRAYQYA